MDLDKYFEENNEMADFLDTPEDFRSGFVTFVGRPNSGKSTLLNALVGEKIAIATNTAQTTRHRFNGIITTDKYQIVITDTPGIHKPKDILGEELNISAEQAIEDVDVVCLLVDATAPVGSGDEFVAKKLESVIAKKIAIISKIDIAKKDDINSQIIATSKLCDFDEIIPLSAKSGENVELLKSTIASLLPQGHLWYDANSKSSVDEDIFISELIREKILILTKEEIPHCTGVIAEEIVYDKKRKIYDIMATIYVERDSQKGIIIGKGGHTLKEIGSRSRRDIEKYLQAKVNLQLSVKVRKNWRVDSNFIRRFGYGE